MRLIDADSQNLQEAIGRMAFRTRQDVYDLIAAQPTVNAVPVVRCKATDEWSDVVGCYISGYMPMRPDDFCNYDKRKDKINEYR